MRRPSWLRSAAWLPALGGAFAPKCPLCVAGYLSAMGLGGSAAALGGMAVVRGGPLLAALALGVLGMGLLLRVARA